MGPAGTDAATAICTGATCPGRTIAAGLLHTCSIGSNGGVRCWGANTIGQLGDGMPSTSSFVAVQVVNVSQAVEVAGGNAFYCVRTTTGAVQCWGHNGEGQFGNGSTSTSPATAQIVPMLEPVVEIALGGRHACARTRSNSVLCWGANFSGQLGIGDVQNTLRPLTVTGLTDAVQLDASEHVTCAVRATGAVMCWGSNSDGQLGNGTVSIRGSNTPVTVMRLQDAAEVAVGGRHVCARTRSGSVRCWGNNELGQLGDGSISPQSSIPVAVQGLTDVVQLAAGSSFTCARRAAGPTVCWGVGRDLALGNGQTESSPVPVQVAELPDAVEITAGNGHVCARRAQGSVVCWGTNSAGASGAATGIRVAIPNPISGL